MRVVRNPCGLLFRTHNLIYSFNAGATKRELETPGEKPDLPENETHEEARASIPIPVNNLNTLSSLIAKRPEAAELYYFKALTFTRLLSLKLRLKTEYHLRNRIEFIKDYVYLYMIRDAGENKPGYCIRDS